VALSDRFPYLRQFLLALALCCSVSIAGVLHGQEAAPAAVPTATALPAQAAQTPPAERDVSWRQLPTNVFHDQKDIWLFPTKLGQGRHWLPTAIVVGATAGLLAADAHDAPYFRRTASFADFNRTFSGKATNLGIFLVPTSFYAIGLIRKDSYGQKTALLAGEAITDSVILSSVMKAASRRLRPSEIAPYGDFSDTFFRRQGSAFSRSFPSGHTITAFSVATVFAQRYRNHRWVPWVAYGTAGAIGFSRITLQAHFPADVFLGAALGYSISRFAVLRH
jgi:membrane-associated phospholipid phosphatase